MEGLLSTLKAAFTLKWSRRTTSANDRTAEVGGIKGDSNTVSIDQSVRPVVVNQPGQTKGDELRMEAIQAIWKATQEIKRTYTAAMFDIDLTYGDVPNDVLFAHPTYTEAKKSLQRDFDRLREIGNCKEYEPYVPSRLWNLFDSYRLLSTRPMAILFYKGDAPARRWWEDEIIRAVLARECIPEELREFAPGGTVKAPHQYVIGLVEQEISAEIRQVTIGEGWRGCPQPD